MFSTLWIPIKYVQVNAIVMTSKSLSTLLSAFFYIESAYLKVKYINE